MRIFKYTAEIYIPNSENQNSYTDKGIVQVDNDSLTKKYIKKQIKKLFFKNKKLLYFKIKQIFIIE